MTLSRTTIFGIAAFLGIGFLAFNYFRTVEDSSIASAPQTIQIDTMLTVVRDVLAQVEADFQTSGIPLSFRYAELDLLIVYTNKQEAGTDLVLIEAGTSLARQEATVLQMRVEPRGSDVSSSSNDLARIVIENTKAAINAAGSDLEVQRVGLTYSIGVKAEASGKAQLAAADLELVSGLSSSSETGNKIRIVFD